MAPTLASGWKKIRAQDKGVAVRSQSEIIAPVRLHGLSTVVVPPLSRWRASSIELSSSSGATDDDEASTGVGMGGKERSQWQTPSARETPQLQIKIYVGSWNMAAKEPFVTKSGAYIGNDAAATKLADLFPSGYDLYVLGAQEKVSKHLHEAVLARLHAAKEHNGRQFVNLRQAAQSRRRPRGRSRAASDTTTASTSSQHSTEEIPSGTVDVGDRFRHSSFALEASANSLGTSKQIAANDQEAALSATPEQAARVSLKEVRGRGDGAFLTPKSTSISIYCAGDVAELVEIVDSGAHKFSFTSGSKGGVAVRLRVSGTSHTMTFANCHLEANKPALRRKQLACLSTKLGQTLGAESLATSSDHVVWMGDFNYRVHTLDGETVLKLLTSGKHLDVHDRYDSMKDDLVTLGDRCCFHEPTKWPTFYPTYKKIPGRPQLLDTADAEWTSKVYRVLYKEPFYKGGQLKARVPGWCDRILYCSRTDERRGGSRLRVEQTSWEGDERDNYRAINDGLCESDHSPVLCTFQWTIPIDTSPVGLQ